MSRLVRGTGPPNPSREAKFSGANGDRGILFFPVQLTTSKIGKLTRSILIPLAICDDDDHTYLYLLRVLARSLRTSTSTTMYKCLYQRYSSSTFDTGS